MINKLPGIESYFPQLKLAEKKKLCVSFPSEIQKLVVTGWVATHRTSPVPSLPSLFSCFLLTAFNHIITRPRLQDALKYLH
jgi:hypothetical protein